MTDALPDLLAKRAELSPDKAALEEVESGRRRTYRELEERAARAASLMAARGVKKGDRVAILCRNRIEFFELLFGCAKLGAIFVPLNWRMPPAELDGLIAHAEPALIFHDSPHAAAVSRLRRPPPAIDLDREFDPALARARACPARSEWPARNSWYLLYTSGTTGRPKGVVYTYGMALANYVNIGTCIGLKGGDTCVAFLPLFHTAGINLHALPALFAGGTVLILDSFDAEAVVALIERRRLDLFFAVPTVYQSLLEHPRFASAPLALVRHWGCGGAPMPPALIDRFRRIGIRLCNGMGMTETGPTAFLMDPADAWDKGDSVGKPQLLCRARIVDGDGFDVEGDDVGHLLFAGPGVTPGYWRDEEATRAAFTADGWLRSGDLARRDSDGFYYVVGRQKEMFISGAENVYPIEVENVLAEHPAVIEAAVVGEPDPRWGEVGNAYVQLAAGAEASASELAAFCRQRLAGYKVPRRFVFVEDFPRTSAGKIQKHLLASASDGASEDSASLAHSVAGAK